MTICKAGANMAGVAPDLQRWHSNCSSRPRVRVGGVALVAASFAFAAAIAWTSDAIAQDFSGDDLTGTTFSNVDFSGADFSDAILEDVLFSGTILVGANFQGALLASTFFQNVDARGANFESSTGTIAFLASDIRDANFFDVHWDESRIQDNTNCSGAVFAAATLGFFIMRSGSVCNDANFFFADMPGGPILRGVQLQNVAFTGVSMPNCDMTNSNLTGSDFTRADIVGCNFLNADMTDVTF